MPHGEPHYKIAGTDREWNGKVIMIAGEPFTTEGGGIEGNNQKLEMVNNKDTQQNQTNTNPVTRTFVSRVVYYRQDGSQVPVGSDLHQHADGTIMLGHDPDNMGEIVTKTSSQRTQTRTTRSMTQRTQTQRRTGGMGGGGRGY